MATPKKKDVLQFDKRVMHRYVTEGKTTHTELEAHLNALPDLSEQCEDIAELIYGHEEHTAKEKHN